MRAAAALAAAAVCPAGAVWPRAPAAVDWRAAEPMALYARTYHDAAGLAAVNGVPWPVLQQRALPCNPNCVSALTGMEAMLRSWGGYIAPDQQLRKVILDDWELVHGLNTTHIELAAHLHALLQLEHNAEQMYDATRTPGNTLPQPSGPQPVVVTQEQSNGFQMSLFYNFNRTDRPGPPFEDMWSCSYSVRNARTGVRLGSIGAQCNPKVVGGQVAWIQQLGFYEGRVSYRIDPRTIRALITGDHL
eukprot:TRINITY_DN13564_c0_g1_i2.p1 TRINITY_DN13564_c0_g1~~TRINITY_DN13564_c0_g1_i2.p1  ORF type:complete len:268 (+),score=94.36 TRINITY_DN13564_c0_g1_i2:67-804(+)